MRLKDLMDRVKQSNTRLKLLERQQLSEMRELQRTEEVREPVHFLSCHDKHDIILSASLKHRA